MKKSKTFIKIIILAFIFAFAIHYSYSFFGINNATKEKKIISDEVENLNSGINTNKYKFKKSNTIILGNVGVALTTNIGMKFKQRQKLNLYKSVPRIGKDISEKSFAEKTSRNGHMGNIKEYYNVLKTDLKSLLNNSINRKDTLEAYIAQLKYRYNSTNANLRVLTAKNVEYDRDLKKYGDEIKRIKANISYNFSNFNGANTDTNIEKLLKAKSNYNYAKAYRTYIAQYIKQYKYLNSKCKKLHDTLKNNKEAIVRNVQITIPKSGTENLKRLEIIINEK